MEWDQPGDARCEHHGLLGDSAICGLTRRAVRSGRTLGEKRCGGQAVTLSALHHPPEASYLCDVARQGPLVRPVSLPS